MTTYKAGYFVGSLSSTSINRILSRALIRVATDDLEFVEIPIDNLPLYSPDFDADYPPEAYIQYSPEVLHDDGEVPSDSTREFLRACMAEFRTYIGMVLTVLPRQRRSPRVPPPGR